MFYIFRFVPTNLNNLDIGRLIQAYVLKDEDKCRKQITGTKINTNKFNEEISVVVFAQPFFFF